MEVVVEEEVVVLLLVVVVVVVVVLVVGDGDDEVVVVVVGMIASIEHREDQGINDSVVIGADWQAAMRPKKKMRNQDNWNMLVFTVQFCS